MKTTLIRSEENRKSFWKERERELANESDHHNATQENERDCTVTRVALKLGLCLPPLLTAGPLFMLIFVSPGQSPL